jgi:asparagine synthase (glutamine-hydrolysing)
MGAICGLITTNQSKEDIRQKIDVMVAAMSFRGADYTGNYVEDSIGLGAAVHSTIGDITQPVSNETGKVIAVCDGEIYNYGQIRSRLIAKGHDLPKGSDIEVIPHLYEDLRDDFAAGLNGIFTIALYDAMNRRLLLVRDHLGSRSVFYAATDSTFVFATTIKEILGTNLIDRQLSPRALDLYFAGTCVPPPYTMFEKIKNIRPGYAVIWENGTVREHEYWSLDNIREDYATSEGDFQKQIRELLIDAVKIRIMGDKPYGSILSGGVDTSLISSVLSSEKADDKLQTFSIYFKEKYFDDSYLQEAMVRKYNLTENKALFMDEMAVDLLGRVIKHSDYPFNNSSAMGTYLCMQNVKAAGLERIFEGEAADELFCGGGAAVGEKLITLFAHLPGFFRNITFGLFSGSLQINKTGKIAAFRRFCQRVCMPHTERMLTWLTAFDREMRQILLVGEWGRYVGKQDEFEPGRFYMDRAKFNDEINLFQYGACKTYLPNDLLFKNERMAAAHGIVNRTPFIDCRLVELAFRIPAKYKLTGFTQQSAEKKLIYRKAIQGLIPDEILWRKKMRGFSQPVTMWMRGGLKDFIQEIILGKRTAERGILNQQFLKRIVEEHMCGKEDRNPLIWSILTLELWMREFVD